MSNQAKPADVRKHVIYGMSTASDPVKLYVNKHAGEMWAMADGQSMTVKIEEKKQENVGLEIFSIRAGH